MQITRAKATALLNKGEMTLYDESRHNPIRGFSASQLETRIERARKARDRSRDLLRRQKVSSRSRTGSKDGPDGAANRRSADKVEIIDDILKRFEARLKEARKLEKDEAASARKSAGSTASKKTARRSERREGRQAARKASKSAAPAKKTAGQATKKTGTATKVAAKKASASTAKGATKKAAGKTAKKSGSSKPASKKVTPKQALRNTRKLLEAKQEEARQPKPWEDATAHGGQVEGDGFQSTGAARRAQELHAAGSRMPAIHGSDGTRDRINQGKRDSKGGS